MLTEKQVWLVAAEIAECKKYPVFVCNILEDLLKDDKITISTYEHMIKKIDHRLSEQTHCVSNIFLIKNELGNWACVSNSWRANWCKAKAAECK